MGRNQLIENNLGRLAEIASGSYWAALHFRFAAPFLTFHTFPGDWVEYYSTNNLLFRDPCVAWALSHTGYITWADLTEHDHGGFFGEAAQFGQLYGAVVSIGPAASRSFVTLGRADRDYTDEELSDAGETLLALHNITKPPSTLPPAEVEALRLLSQGVPEAEASAQLGVSSAAFAARLSSARVALFARTNTEAVLRAKDHKLI